MSVGLNLLRLMLIAVTLISYTPIKRCLNRLPFVSVFSEISMIMLSVISLLSYQQSAYISLIIPTLRITFQLCNITSALFKYYFPFIFILSNPNSIHSLSLFNTVNKEARLSNSSSEGLSTCNSLYL